MPLSPAVSIGSVNTGATIDPSAIVVDDISTGSDVAIVSREILLFNVQNTQIVATIPWPLATNPITINPLTTDIALNVLVNWLDSGGTAIYNLSILAAFTGYGEQFDYNLTQTESSQPGILQDVNYQSYRATLRNYLDAAVQAIAIGRNQGNSEAMILKEIFLVKNSNIYY